MKRRLRSITLTVKKKILKTRGLKNNQDIIQQDTSKEEYSDKKIKANSPPKYSVLKPDTSSDSDSEKSKGAR
jgi:hypothetical protein